MSVEFNINDMCEVVLTAYGAEVYNKFHEGFKFFRPEVRKEGDVLKDQLWSLMQVFGPSIALGREVPFELCGIKLLKEVK